jgi:regulator of replication initiation timing
VIYRDQPYYKEFRDLLTRLRSGLSHLKHENRQLADENESLSQELREVRTQLADAKREVEKQKEFASQKPVPGSGPGVISDNDAHIHEDDSASIRDGRSESTEIPSLFVHLSDSEKIAMRQQITELIQKIDRHLAESGKS